MSRAFVENGLSIIEKPKPSRGSYGTWFGDEKQSIFRENLAALIDANLEQRLILNVNSQKFSSTTEIMEAMKDLFRDALQQVMEGELEETLGHEKSERTEKNSEKGESKSYRNWYSQKSVKT